MKVVNRLTVADVMRGAKAPKRDAKGEIETKDGKPVMVSDSLSTYGQKYLIIGKARETKDGVTQYGTYTEYFGAFEVRRIGDGEVLQSGRAIFPPPTDAVVYNGFAAAKAQDQNAEVSFAFIIGTEEHKHGDETKYRFTCEPIDLGDQVTDDPLAQIKEAIAGNSAVAGLLEGPKAAPAKGGKAAKETEPAT